MTSTNICASSPGRQRIASPSPLPEKITSIKEGSSCGAKARLIKRPQAGVLKLRNISHARSERADRGRTALRYGGCSGVLGINGCRAGSGHTAGGVFMERRVENAEYLLDLQFVPFNLFLVIFNMRCVRHPPESLLDTAYHPRVVWWKVGGAEINWRTFQNSRVPSSRVH